MKKVLFILSFIFALTTYSQEATTYYLIRHAEKTRTDFNNKDPFLSFKGYKRADHWKEIFKTVKFDAVYSTNYNRTKETAQPTAAANNVPILLYDPSEMYSESFKYNTKGKNVLIVGHSNTTPLFVNKILGKDVYPLIEDTNNSNLYIVTVIDDKASAVVLNIEYNQNSN